MAPASITCDARLEDGSKCSAAMTVVKTQYVYDRKPLVGDPATFTLKETHYHGTCPNCGGRTVVEKH